MSTQDRRPDWPEWAFGIADAVSRRADCTRRKVGAIILDEENRLISSGYNGAPPGEPGCLSAGACPRGRHFLKLTATGGECACGKSWPCEDSVAPGSSYDAGKGTCIALHAEQNCIIWARHTLSGMTMYCTDEPCDGCTRMVKGAKLKAVYWPKGEYVF